MFRATGIERPAARGTGRSAIEVFPHAHPVSAGAAKDRDRIKFLLRPNGRVVLRKLLVTEMARKPFTAAFKLQRNDVCLTVIVRAARFRIDIDSANFDQMDCARHVSDRSRGQINTSNEPTIQQMIITIKPALNEPVL